MSIKPSCCVLVLAWTCRRSRAVFLQQEQERQQREQRGQERQQQHPRPADAPRATSEAGVQRVCSRSQLIERQDWAPGQPVLLGCAFMVLLAVVTWNLLHVGVTWLLPRLDELGPAGLVAGFASEHGLAASCFPQGG